MLYAWSYKLFDIIVAIRHRVSSDGRDTMVTSIAVQIWKMGTSACQMFKCGISGT